ncbi:MAG: hypothetical protein ACI9UA_003937, partial [Pseudoalteromonas tetraodonis]
MRRLFLPALSFLLTIGIAEAKPDQKEGKQSEFAHFLEADFPFAEIVVDARSLGQGFPEDNLTPRGLVVRLGKDTYIAYDTDLCRVACAWKGGFLTEESLATKSYHRAKNKKGGGQMVLPTPIGTPIFANGLYPGVQLGGEPKFEDPRPAGKDPREIGRGALPEGMARWRGTTVSGTSASVNYEIDGIEIVETPRLTEHGTIARSFFIKKNLHRQLVLVLGTGDCRVSDLPGSELVKENGINLLTLAPTREEIIFEIFHSDREIDPSSDHFGFPVSAPNWTGEVITKGHVMTGQESYAVDPIDLPINNPKKRNIRPSGIDFFADGRAAIVTFDGDVWIASGLDAKLESITWKRIAGGLHEPNAIRIRSDDEILVFGKNGITKITSSDGGLAEPPGWTTTYENICSDFWQSAETRDMAHSMDIAADGSLFITKGGQQNDLPSKHSGRVLKISPDGEQVRIFASGLRNAYLTIRPGTNEIYASDQQGHWVPATPIHRIVRGGYYGFKPAAPWGVQEPPITPPLCWIPHAVAASGLGPVWADKDRFGPVSDSLIYLDFQRPRLLRTYLSDRDGQAAAVPMPLQFDFPLLKGAINPIDGQLYVVGFQIWGTSAKDIRG